MRPLLALLVLMATACGERSETIRASAEGRQATDAEIVLVDATTSTGITFVHRAGHSAARLLPETMGSGVAIFDADGDELPEIAFGDLGALDGAGGGVSLWRNLGDLRFEPVVAPDGIASSLHVMGLATADWDGDGRMDLLVTGVDGDELWLGREGLAFERAVGGRFVPPPPGFSASATFVDGDGTGRLEVLIGRYVDWGRERDLACRLGGERVYCTPESYPAVASRWLVADGDALRDETAGSAFAAHPGKALGLALVDADGDGRPDLALAHDTAPNQLFLSRPSGFQEDALARGFAVGMPGVARGGMGIAAGDLDADGREDLVVSNFAREAIGIFRAGPDGQFHDAAPQAGVGLATYLPLAFGVVLVDLDLDGALDLVVANGHIEPTIEARSGGGETWGQPLQVFRNGGDGRFFEVRTAVERRPYVGRGLAAGDLDGDGDVDLVLSQNDGPPAVLRNDSKGGRSLRVRLVGQRNNRTAIGAWMELERADGRRLGRRLTTSGSYLSASEPVVTFGLGSSAAQRLRIRWPSGAEDDVDELPTAGRLVLDEP